MNYQVARMPNDKGKVKFNLHGFFSIFPSEFKLQGIITQTTYELLEKSINVFPRKALVSVSLGIACALIPRQLQRVNLSEFLFTERTSSSSYQGRTSRQNSELAFL